MEVPEIESKEIERSLIGIVLIKGIRAVEELEAIGFSGRFFKSEACRIAWRAVHGVIQDGGDVDLITVVGWLHDRKIGSGREIEAITMMSDNIPGTENVTYYGEAVRNRAARRQLIARSLSLIDAAGNMSKTPDDLEGLAIDVAKAINVSAKRNSTATSLELMTALIAQVEDPTPPDIWSTGIETLDQLLMGGLAPGRQYIIGARPKMGKSAMAINIAANFADAGRRVLFFSLEMMAIDRDQERARVGEIPIKIAALMSGIPATSMMTRSITDLQRRKLYSAAERIAEWPLDVDDSPRAHLSTIVSKARRYKLQHPDVALIVIDYVGLVSGDPRKTWREQIGETSRSLKALAKELRVCVLILAQINRQAEHRNEKRPTSSDLKESGDLEQDADGVILLNRLGLHDGGRDDRMWVRLDLHRHGPPGEVVFNWDGSIQKISDPITSHRAFTGYDHPITNDQN